MPDLSAVAIELRVVSPEPTDQLQRLFEAWKERCPIYLALVEPVPAQATLTVAAGA